MRSGFFLLLYVIKIAGGYANVRGVPRVKLPDLLSNSQLTITSLLNFSRVKRSILNVGKLLFFSNSKETFRNKYDESKHLLGLIFHQLMKLKLYKLD